MLLLSGEVERGIVSDALKASAIDDLISSLHTEKDALVRTMVVKIIRYFDVTCRLSLNF